MMLARFSISFKLLILSTLPLLLLSLFLFNEGNQLHKEKESSYQTKIIVKLTKSLGDIAHYHALERGLTQRFLGENGSLIKNDLLQKRKKSDSSVMSLKKFLNQHNLQFQDIDTNINSLLDLIKQKKSVHQRIDRGYKSSDAFSYYSLVNKQAIDTIDRLTVFIDNNILHKELNSLVALLWLKERSAQSRGMLNGIYANGAASIDDYNNVYKFVVNFKSNLEVLTKNRKFHAQAALIEAAKKPIFARIDTIHDNFLKQSKKLSDIVGPSPAQWFPLATQRVDALHFIVDIQSSHIAETAHKIFFKSNIYLVVGSIGMLIIILVLIFLSYKISLNISSRILNIEVLLTRSINDSDLSVRLDTEGSDEITHIAKGINNYIGWMGEIMNGVKKSSLENEHLANHDPLTKLANRSLFLSRLANLTDQLRNDDKRHALLYIDLDFFKNINDIYGHMIGDKVLQALSHILVESVRDTDTTARLGGDEFAVILQKITASQTQLVSQKIINKIKTPLKIDNLTLNISVSIGITFFPTEEFKDPTALLKEADQALYEAKNSGRNQFQFFDEALKKAHEENNQLEIDLDYALKNQEIQPHFQPQYCLVTQEIVGLEALARWEHPIKGLISPNIFVPLAERRSLITVLTESIMRQTYTHLSTFMDVQPNLKVALNVSGSECSNPRLLHLTQQLLKEHQLKPEQIELEITESVLVEHPETSARNLAALHKLGVSIAIDDFGTGYSSLSYLTTLPIDILKIDMSFVQGIGIDPQQEIVIQVIIDLAKRLSLKVVAEGIETQAQANFLTSHGCDYGQGYFYSKPCCAEDIHKILKQNRISCSHEQVLV
jgi:diguanylate cyclase (GGDEF)-like protein